MIAIATRNAMGFTALDHFLPDDVLLLLGINWLAFRLSSF
jgi:hypothetical protein